MFMNVSECSAFRLRLTHLRLTVRLINHHHHRYQGQWTNDFRSGQGQLILPDGACYSGQFVDDCMRGQGEVCASDGQIIYQGRHQQHAEWSRRLHLY
jgi:hypothetical protein